MSRSRGLAMGFVGVDTAASSIRRVFPAWAEILGLPTARLVGYDLPLGASRERYRELVVELRDDPTCAGALITAHKIGVYQAAADLFDELDPFSSLCGEISSVSKRDDKLVGHAKDPVTVGLAVEEIITPDYFDRAGGHVLCMGTGGAGIALAWYLAQRTDPPRRMVYTARRSVALGHLFAVLERAGLDTSCVHGEVVHAAADGLLADLPAGSLVVNATGMGKDLPGSPLSDRARFPERGIAWDFNYRGSLEFLDQARTQRAERGLQVVDGWRYFIHGWSQVVAEVFGLTLTDNQVDELAAAAEHVR